MNALNILALALFVCHEGAYVRCGIADVFEADPEVAAKRVFDGSDFVGFVRRKENDNSGNSISQQYIVLFALKGEFERIALQPFRDGDVVFLGSRNRQLEYDEGEIAFLALSRLEDGTFVQTECQAAFSNIQISSDLIESLEDRHAD
jgi:hypothetical protein|tara:strand:- start:292 stop:732 length:441 start_codon:yes stop_codon:yes gene_type:complete